MKSKKFKSTMPEIKMSKNSKPLGDDICAQCGWRRDHHRADGSGWPTFCYHYSDEDTDYFYKDREFIPLIPGKKYNRAFDGRIIL